MYDAPPIVNDTLSIVEDAIYREEEEDQGVIFPEGGDDPEQRTPYTRQARAREQENIW